MNLERRLQANYNNGSIKTHYQYNHKKILTKEILQQNTTIFSEENNLRKLVIKEAFNILNEWPYINIQFNDFTNVLRFHQHRNHLNRNNNNVFEDQGTQKTHHVKRLQEVHDVQDL